MTDVTDGACRDCARRSWLLSKLSVRLDYRSRDESRLLELLELDDEELIEAIGGRRRRELKEQWWKLGQDQVGEPDERGAKAPGATSHGVKEMDATAPGARPAVETVCRHSGDYPRGLGDRQGAPRMLYVVGARKRLQQLTAEPAVAIVGSDGPTDYGMEMARSLARGLAASGVTVVSAYANGIAAAAHAGALEVDGPTVTVMAGGVDVVTPASRRALYERVRTRGCAVAEPPCGFVQRRWCKPARARTVAGLAGLTIVVEADADESKCELIVARVAQGLGRTVAAIPGRVSSPVSRGTNMLLMEGAPLVRGPGDALDLLYGVGASRRSRLDAPRPGASASGAAHEHGSPAPRPGRPGSTRLEPRLQAVLEQVGAGRDTPGKLTSAGEDAGETMLALTELELMGLLGRGDGGRYVPREGLPDWAVG
jgi:DNA processing protein